MGDERWQALVSAEKDVVERRAEFNRLESERDLLLAASLKQGGNWDKRTALMVLSVFSGSVPPVLGEVIDIAIHGQWARLAREVLAAADRTSVLAALSSLTPGYLDEDDAQVYRRLAVVLVAVEAWDMLGELVRRARGSTDPELIEAGEDFWSRYGPMLR
jgi:hypothetical protein